METPSTTTPKFKSAMHDNGQHYVPVAAIIGATTAGALTTQALRKRCKHAEKRDAASVWRPTREEMPSLIAQGHFCFGATTGLLVREEMVAAVAPEAFGAPARKRKQPERSVEAKIDGEPKDDDAPSLTTPVDKSARISPPQTAPAHCMTERVGEEAETLQSFDIEAPPRTPDFLSRPSESETKPPSPPATAAPAATAPARSSSPSFSNCTTETEASTTLPRFLSFTIAAPKPAVPIAAAQFSTPSSVNAVASSPSAGQIRRRGTLATPQGLTEDQRFMVRVGDAYASTFVDSAKQHNFRKCIRQIIANQPVKRSGTPNSRIRNGDLTSSTLFVETAMPSNCVGGSKLTIGCSEFAVWKAMARRLGCKI